MNNSIKIKAKLDNIVSIVLIIIFLVLASNALYLSIMDLPNFEHGPSYGFISTNRVNFSDGIFLIFLGIIQVSSYLFPNVCFLYKWLTNRAKKSGKIHFMYFIMGLVCFFLGVNSLLSK